MAVLEFGSEGVRVLDGPAGRSVDPGLARAALDWIDDPVGLYGERPVAVADLWRTLMTTALGQRCESVVLVHPDDWPSHRIDRVVAAANTVAEEVLAVRRRDWNPAPRNDRSADDAVRPRRRRTPWLFGVAAVGVVVAVAALVGPDPATPGDITTVADGRIAVQFPRSWTIARVTEGPGSRRLQANSPADPNLAVHLTQSYTPEATLAQTAAVLRRAIADQPVGVFVDFDAEAKLGELPVVRYRELRPGRVIEWTVLLIGSTRVAVGCQSPPGRADEVQPVCAQAATSARETSAHETGTDSRH